MCKVCARGATEELNGCRYDGCSVLQEKHMLKTHTTNIILALCISAVLIAFALYERHTGASVPIEVFYGAAAVFFLARCRASRKRCGV